MTNDSCRSVQFQKSVKLEVGKLQLVKVRGSRVGPWREDVAWDANSLSHKYTDIRSKINLIISRWICKQNTRYYALMILCYH